MLPNNTTAGGGVKMAQLQDGSPKSRMGPDRIGRLRQFEIKRGRLVLVHELEGIAFKAIREHRRAGSLAVFDTTEPEICRCLIAASPEQITFWKASGF